MNEDISSENYCQTTTYTDLPVEIWTKILLYLKPSNIIQIQNVCSLWFDVIQNFIAEGLIKSDAYVSKIKKYFFKVMSFIVLKFMNILLILSMFRNFGDHTKTQKNTLKLKALKFHLIAN